jgi:acyl-CoA synthetase (AMP-forming)/AMP-acid ligase II/acyl carrier protein
MQIVEESDIGEVLRELAQARPSAAALHVPGRGALSFADLGAQLDYVRERLAAWDIARGDIVAGFVDSRAEMAVACAAFPATSTFAPLSQALSSDAYAELLGRLRPKAVLVPDAPAHPLVAAARALELAEIRIACEPNAPPGTFTLELSRSSAPDAPAAWNPSFAYVLATAGTTGRPKLVPLERAQIMEHARVMKDWLRYTADDLGCHLLPMRLGHGLRNALMVPWLTGQAIVCLDEGDIDGFFRAFDDFGPTYLTAGFTVHRELLRRAGEHAARLRRGRLRFLRVGAGRLEPWEIDRLEQTFGVPALKGLSMTEACAVTQDPLPPRPRKNDGVGLPVGSEVAVRAASGELLGAGESGELVVRGPLVVRGYLDDPELTARSFADGWFRTGDLGHVDADGCVHVAGRLKEMINRGGEKLSPVQIDAELQSLPGVKEAAAFGVAHPTFGEEVVAAVVRQAGAAIDAEEVIAHARRRVGLAGAPRRIYFVDRLPRNEGGKVRRGELAALAGLEGGLPSATANGGQAGLPARSPLETAVAALFAAILCRADIGSDDDFFLGGGDSLSGAQLLAQVQSAFGVQVPPRALFAEAATVSGMARAIERLRAGAAPVP